MNRLLVFLLFLGVMQSQLVADESVALPITLYREAAEQGIPVYKVDTDRSRADILVFKGGKLARFGHDHVVSTTKIDGFVRLPAHFADSRADLIVPLTTLEVDREEIRREYGMDNKVSDSAKRGTRENMLKKVLEVVNWPIVAIQVTPADGNTDDTELNVGFTMHGAKQNFRLPASMQKTDSKLHIQGKFVLLHSNYGMEPYTALAGGLRVQDNFEVHFNLVAIRYHFDE